MKNENFFQQLADLLEIPVSEVTPDRKLDDFQLWDSLASVSTLAIVDQCFGVALCLQDFINCKTVSDILNRIPALCDAETTL